MQYVNEAEPVPVKMTKIKSFPKMCTYAASSIWLVFVQMGVILLWNAISSHFSCCVAIILQTWTTLLILRIRGFKDDYYYVFWRWVFLACLHHSPRSCHCLWIVQQCISGALLISPRLRKIPKPHCRLGLASGRNITYLSHTPWIVDLSVSRKLYIHHHFYILLDPYPVVSR